MHGLDDALIGLRAGDRQHVGEALGDRFGLGAHAAGDDDLAVFLQRGADRLERLRLGAVEEAARVDDDDVGPGVGARQLVAFGAQLRENALAIDERLRAAERDEGDARRRSAASGVPAWRPCHAAADFAIAGSASRRQRAGESEERDGGKNR